MRQLAAALVALLAVGCCRPQVVPHRVEVPVPVPCPEPPYLAWPVLPISKVTAATPPAEVARAYAVTVEVLQASLWQAMRVLDGYRTKTTPTTPPAPARTAQ